MAVSDESLEALAQYCEDQASEHFMRAASLLESGSPVVLASYIDAGLEWARRERRMSDEWALQAKVEDAAQHLFRGDHTG